MCGLFLSTRAVSDCVRTQVSYLLERRGTLPSRWHAASDGCTLAHSLLPIRGREPRTQPVCGTSGTLLFTGELWDTVDATCDTDAVLSAVETHGPRRAFASFDGNWAVVYWRASDCSIHFATDPIGEQPLHFATIDGHLGLATEIKVLVAAAYPLKSIKPVVPGYHYEYTRVLSQTPYCPPRASRKLAAWSPAALRGRIRRAVREQAAAHDFDHDVAVLFSGGLDSSIIAYEAARVGVRRAFTVALHDRTEDAIRAATVARALGLDWRLIQAVPDAPARAVVAGEIANRSIVEEMTMHLPLAAHLQSLGIHIVLTGCGADELFIGYQHLLGRLPHAHLQEHFLSRYYRFDLRALNKLYGGFKIEVRNPFLSRRVVDYARRIPTTALLDDKRRLKAPLRQAYARILGDASRRPKLIARETMGVKRLFAERLGDSPYLFRPLLTHYLGSPRATLRLLAADREPVRTAP